MIVGKKIAVERVVSLFVLLASDDLKENLHNCSSFSMKANIQDSTGQGLG